MAESIGLVTERLTAWFDHHAFHCLMQAVATYDSLTCCMLKPTQPRALRRTRNKIIVAIYGGDLKLKGKGNCIAVMEHHDTTTECHLPYGITQCYLLPDTSERTSPSPQPVRPVLDLPTPEVRPTAMLMCIGYMLAAPIVQLFVSAGNGWCPRYTLLVTLLAAAPDSKCPD